MVFLVFVLLVALSAQQVVVVEETEDDIIIHIDEDEENVEIITAATRIPTNITTKPFNGNSLQAPNGFTFSLTFIVLFFF